MRVAAIVIAALVASPGYARSMRPKGAGAVARPSSSEGWTLTVGIAPVLSPAWQGSKDYSLSLFPDLRINYRDLFFASVPEGIGLNVINKGGWRAGPVVKLRFGRDEDRGGSPFLIAGGSKALLRNIVTILEMPQHIERRAFPLNLLLKIGAWHKQIRGELVSLALLQPVSEVSGLS